MRHAAVTPYLCAPMQHIAHLFLRGLAALFRLLPWSALPYLSDGLAFVLYRVLGYRRSVVFGNLRRVFPTATDAELRRIAWKSYQNLTDVTLETIKAFTAPLTEVRERCPCINPELVNAHLDKGQTVLVTGSHYNNWELACLSIPERFHAPAVTVYKPLSNKAVDKYYNQNRARGGTLLASMEETFGMIRRRREEASAFLFLSDQSPSSRKSAQWVTFLGQESAFLPGVDVIARKFNYPVLHFKIKRVRRGFYELRYETLFENPAKAAEGDITRAYATCVEAEILDQPENWLWSHRRWKMEAP
jgi:Kdo2-lipid IVA lauroyltransferase/acyltransferase